MPIDPNSVQWDDAPAAPMAIDPASVQWDDTPAPKRELPKVGASTLLAGLGPLSMLAAPISSQMVKDASAGAIRGAGSIGATLMAPVDVASDYLDGKGLTLESNRERRQAMDEGLAALGANPDSGLYQAGKLGGEIAGTAGAGPALAGGARVAGASPAVVSALQTGGLNVGGMTGIPGLLTRGAAGAAVGGTAAGMVNPEDAGVGAALGAALPVGVKVGGGLGRRAGRAIAGQVSPEVAQLANRAKELGVQIPADRITNSKPLNALASSLEYMPLSGRAATQERMTSQLNKALSRTFGQDSDNVTMALRKAGSELGGKFDDVLQNNRVRVDDEFLNALGEQSQRATAELGSDGQRIIQNQIDEILAKAQNGEIDGQAAYNIKKTLDRIGKRNSPEAYYALDLKNSLMGALNRSLGPEEAAAFAKTRQQYGNMLKLEKIAKNGAEGDISVARLANMKNINSPDLQELADIASQFMLTRESPHGALQRLVIGSTGLGVGAGLGGLPIGIGLMAGGRGANSALNSGLLRSMVTGQTAPVSGETVRSGLLGVSRALPALSAQ